MVQVLLVQNSLLGEAFEVLKKILHSCETVFKKLKCENDCDSVVLVIAKGDII